VRLPSIGWPFASRNTTFLISVITCRGSLRVNACVPSWVSTPATMIGVFPSVNFASF
jgi:hypothetical protein